MAYIDGIPIKDSLHTDFSTSSGDWAEYRHQLTGDYVSRKGTGSNYHEFADGTFREYNKKLNDLNINGSESIFLEPYDAGFRYKGDPLIARFPSGIAGGFSCRNIGFGGPIVKVRRSTDNTEVDVRGDNDGVLSLNSPIIDYRENLVTQSETFSSWNNVTTTLTASQSDPFGSTNATLFESERVEFDFSSSAGWTVGTNWAINTTNGLATRTGGGSGTNLSYGAWTLESGKTYKVIIDVKTLDDGTCNVYDATNGVTYKNDPSDAGTFTSVGDNQSFTFTATATGVFALRSSSNNLAVTNLTIMEVLGTARREILTTVVANQVYNGSVFVKAGTSDNFQVQFVDNENGYANRGLLKVDVAADGSFSTATATSISNVIYTASSNGFTRVSFSFTPSASTAQLSMRLFPDRDNGLDNTIFFGAQLSNGQTVEKYIKTSGSTITELDRPQETLGEYIGTGHAYATTWYDQSAVGSDQKNFQQTTASYQPLVVENGAMITGGNGKAGVKWDVGKSMYIDAQFPNGKIDAFFVSDFDVSDAIGQFRERQILLTSSGTSNYIIMDSGSTSTAIGALGNANKTLRVNGVDYNPNDPDLTRSGVFQLLDGNKLYSTVGGNSSPYTGTHNNILNLGFYNSDANSTFNFEGLMQETIIYTGDQLSTRTGIETQMNNYYNMF